MNNQITQTRKFEVFMIGVGGQGIGLLSEILIRAVDYSGQVCVGVDTHGLAQRGGIVSSHLKIGDVNSPLVIPGNVDLVLALERHEAARGMNYLKDSGVLAYYDTSWQPLAVRIGKTSEITDEEIETTAKERNIKVYRVFRELPDVRMQNIALLGTVAKYELIPGVSVRHYIQAMEDLMNPKILEENKKIFLEIVEVE